jgi:hypothetical protein
MPVRYATRRYPDMVALLRDWDSSLKASTVVLDAENLGGEPAAEVGIDLVLPGRKAVRTDRGPADRPSPRA